MKEVVRRRIVLALLGIVLPTLLALAYVDRYGVNVPVHDEWNFLPILERFYEGSDWWPLVLEHYGEHRIVLPKMILLAVAPWTDYDVKVLMVLSVLMMAATALLLAWLVRGDERVPDWVIVPIGWLLLSTAQFENLLVGWQFQIPLMNMLAVGAVVVLAGGATVGRQLGAGALAFGATFSFANGLLIWPAALPLVLAGDREGRWRRAGLWMGLASLTAVLYAVGYRGFDRPPAGYLTMALRHPDEALGLFIGLVGNNVGLGRVVPSLLAGCLLLLWLVAVAWGLRRFDRWRTPDLPWLALLLFSLLSTLAVVAGRSFDWDRFITPSRYLTLTVFIPIVAWVASGRLLALGPIRRSRPLVAAMAVAAGAFVLAAGLTADLGWSIAQADRAVKLSGRRCLVNYREAPLACLRQLYLIDGEQVRRLAPFLEAESLGPFAGSAAMEAELVAHGSIDLVAGTRLPAEEVEVEVGASVVVEGWALTGALDQPASVLIGSEGRWLAVSALFFLRPDVADAFGETVPPAGWRMVLPTESLGLGEHRLQLWVLPRGSTWPVEVPGQVVLTIRLPEDLDAEDDDDVEREAA